MEPNTKRLEFKVGIFIAVGLLALLSSIIVLGGDRSLFTSYVYLRARFGEVQGLLPGSVVSLSGIPVGNVERIRFVPNESRLEIIMKIDQKYRDRLVEGTIAEVRTQGALGDKYVYLAPGEPKGKKLSDGALVEVNETDYFKLLTDREDGVARVVDLVKEMHILVGNINSAGKTTETVRNMAEASGQLKSTLKQLDTLVSELRSEIPENKKLKTALVSLSSVLEKIDQGKGTLGQLINDPTLHQNLKSYLGGSQRNRYMKDMIRETIQKGEASQ